MPHLSSRRLFDISVPISADLAVYEGDPPTNLELWSRMRDGAVADVSRLEMGVHTGTRVDAPAHFLPGASRVDAIDLDACIGPAVVVDLTSLGYRSITAAALESRLPDVCARVILKTANSRLWGTSITQPEVAALEPEGAAFLVERKVRLVGIDYLSVAPAQDPATVHRILLSAGVVILEGLDLSDVPEGSYTLLCLPLRLDSAEAAPARAVLLAVEGALTSSTPST